MASKKRAPNPGYLCTTCGKQKRGSHSDVLKNADGTVKWSTSFCPACFADGKEQKYTFEVHIDSYGNQEFITAKCPTHGHIKQIMAERPEARFQSNFFRWRTGGATVEPPKPFREV